ncbi:hotdog fold thioesterase [Pseudonocardia xinjiangensis]
MPGRCPKVRIVPVDPDPLPSSSAVEQLADRMGIVLVKVGLDEVVGTLPVAGNRQPFGLLHGGANAVLAETLGSTLSALHAMPERFPVGLELSCTHHAAATEGIVTGVARPLHVGRTTSTTEIVITDARGRRTCTAKLTCLHRDSRP